MKKLSILKTPGFWILTIIILLVALSRLVDHPWNFTPVAAIALFGGAYFINKRWAIIVPLLALFISDLFIGLYSGMIFTYAGFAIIVLIGMRLSNNIKPIPVLGAALLGGITFYIITNFETWLMWGIYPKTLTGLIDCYVLAIPFFRSTIAGDLIYTAILFGGFELIKMKFPKLAVQKT